ncbi:nitrogenase stabilizing/protective protein NifW [Sorangium sp. So ce1024]|uniref:nitrogenase stabilizing/protective protein NifW n=1 Tax=unclassified Sorangium TaxID=2621164 RepID=UPI003F0A8ACA
MSVLDDLRRLSAAEDFFRYLDVAYDPAVLNVARLHILRRMGETLARDALTGLDDAAVRASCRGHLVAAYNDFVTRSPLEERVFKVLKDAVKPRKGAFVPLEALGAKKSG